MSKEMTESEIAEINRVFDSTNAFTKWKFMQTEEYKKLPDAVRYSVERECLTHYFNMMTDGMSNWKMPFHAVIPIRLLNPCRAAAEYFTGARLLVMKQEDETNFKVYCKGYYNAVGA